MKEAVLPGVCQHVLLNGISWFREGEPQLADLLEAMTLTFALLYFTRDRVDNLQLCSNLPQTNGKACLRPGSVPLACALH